MCKKQICPGKLHTCATYEVPSMNYVTRKTAIIFCKLHFMLLAYITNQIWLPHCKYWSHCYHTVCTYIPVTDVHECHSTTNNIYFNHICIKVPESNMVIKLQINTRHTKHLICIYGVCLFINVPLVKSLTSIM